MASPFTPATIPAAALPSEWDTYDNGGLVIAVSDATQNVFTGKDATSQVVFAVGSVGGTVIQAADGSTEPALRVDAASDLAITRTIFKVRNKDNSEIFDVYGNGSFDLFDENGNSLAFMARGATPRLEVAPGGSTTMLYVGTNTLAFYGASATTKPTGVAVTAAAIHAALVTLGLIAA